MIATGIKPRVAAALVLAGARVRRADPSRLLGASVAARSAVRRGSERRAIPACFACALAARGAETQAVYPAITAVRVGAKRNARAGAALLQTTANVSAGAAVVRVVLEISADALARRQPRRTWYATAILQTHRSGWRARTRANTRAIGRSYTTLDAFAAAGTCVESLVLAA
jgi:hypothetical protein